jgi:hypothetical protein
MVTIPQSPSISTGMSASGQSKVPSFKPLQRKGGITFSPNVWKIFCFYVINWILIEKYQVEYVVV